MSPKKSEWISPSDEQNSAAQKMALKAAWEALATLRSSNADLSPSRQTRVILEAFAAVREVAGNATAALRAQNPEKLCHSIHIDAHCVVATALSFLHDLPSSAHPYSVAGTQMVDFARACKALDAYSELVEALGDEPEMSSGWAAERLISEMYDSQTPTGER